jgi:hypothetical protein
MKERILTDGRLNVVFFLLCSYCLTGDRFAGISLKYDSPYLRWSWVLLGTVHKFLFLNGFLYILSNCDPLFYSYCKKIVFGSSGCNTVVKGGVQKDCISLRVVAL